MKIKQQLKYLLQAAGCFSLLVASGQEYTFRPYTSSDGLAGEVVHTMMQDSYGFLWIGTGNGLSRFDGKSFKNYTYTEGLRDLAVLALYEDKQHRLWVGTTRGITQLNKGRFIAYSNRKNESLYVFSFIEAGDNGLMAFTSKGTYRYNDGAWTKINLLPGYNESNCQEIVQSQDGLYLNYEDALFFKKKGAAPVLLKKDTSDDTEYFCSQLTAIQGKVYAAIRNQLYELAAGKMHLLIDSIQTNHFFNFTIDTGNTCWINISGKGLYKYRLSRQKRENAFLYKYDSNTAGYPFIDNQHNLWITSYEGLIKVIPKIFEDIPTPKKTDISKRLNVIPAGRNEIILSDGSGLSLLKNGKFIQFKKPVSYKDENSYHLDIVEGSAKDSRQFTWMITRQRKMLCWNGTQLLDFSRLLVPRARQYIRNLSVNPLDNRVFICDDSTLICGNENKFGPFIDRNGSVFPKTTTVLFTHNGIGIVNVNAKGIYFITRQNEIIKAPSELDIIDKGSYTYFFEDKEGWVWISNAGKGLVHFRIDENTYSVNDLTILTTDQGLPSNKIANMVFDNEGNKWVSCSNGLVILKPHPANSSVWDIYTIGKEQNINLTGPLEMTTDDAANVWLASLDKLIRVDAQKLLLKKVTPSVVIDKVMLDMKETDWSKFGDSTYSYFQLPVSPVLNYAQNTLGLEFYGVSVYNADYFEYAYQLEPLDKTWSSASPGNYISFVNLSPGAYVFNVKARGRGTDWSRPAVFRFTIKPPFWDSWPFRLLIAGLASAIIVSIYFGRIKKIQDRAEIQNQLRELEMKALKAQMNPHFIYNALNSIQSLIADEKKSEAINYIGTFSRLLRHVLEYTENNVISLEKELQTLRLYIELESLRLNMDLHYTITTADEVICENEKLPPLTLQPFVENALWHGLSRKQGDKLLTIAVSQTVSTLIIAVEDNGIGRASAAVLKKQSSTDLYPSKGIDITAKRLRAFNRSNAQPVEYCDLVDSLGNSIGTRVTVTINRHSS